jgi:hypothetical protein
VTSPQVPGFIDANARHRMKTLRVLNYAALRGQQGVLESDDLKVTALGTPGGSVNISPGVFGIVANHVGGANEAYIDKVDAQLTRGVNATDATVGGRTDLVIARVLNPYVTETGSSIPIPASAQDGPYWDVQVLHGVTANIQSVAAWNPNYSAIALARITRPVNTGIVQQSHITDLRQLISFTGGERITVINNPPPESPPIAQAIYTNSKEFATTQTLAKTITAWTDFPTGGYFDVPIPSWAVEVDINGIFTPQFNGSIWAEARLSFGGTAGPSTFADENPPGGAWQRLPLPLLGTYPIPSAQRGKVIRVQLQMRMLDPPNHTGDLTTRRGVYVSLWTNFKRLPE